MEKGIREFGLAILMLVAGRPGRAQSDGSARWAGPFTTGGIIVSSPAVGTDGTVFVGSEDNYLYALNSSGSLKWRFPTGDWIDSSPAIGSDGTIYVGSWDGKLYALRDDGTKATKKWDYSVGSGNFIYSSPAIGADGSIYFGAGDGLLHALRADGTSKWSYPAGDWIDSSPAVGRDGTIYYGSWDGSVYAIRDDENFATGLWRFTTGGAVLSSPALGQDGAVYIGSQDGRMYALDGATGRKRWESVTGGAIDGSAAIGPDGTVYFGSDDGYFYAVAREGVPRWRYPVGAAVVSTPAVRADGTIVFGAYNNAIYCLNSDGTTKWKATTGDRVESSPGMAADGSIYVGCFDRRIYALNGSDSPVSTVAPWPMFRRDAKHPGREIPAAWDGRLVNLSTRALAGPGKNLIPGFVVVGSGTKSLLVRGVGPTLQQLGVSNVLADPRIELYSQESREVVAQNDNWSTGVDAGRLSAVFATAGAFALPEGSKDAALVASLPVGAYTALTTSVDGTGGIALVEVYDVDLFDTGARLINLSTRGYVGTGEGVLTPGLVIGGGSLRLLIRAVGPGLVQFGVPGVLTRPSMSLFSGQTVKTANAGWTTSAYSADIRAVAQLVGAFPLEEGSTDSALLVTLPPGPYTVQVSGVNATTGEALVEVYVVP